MTALPEGPKSSFPLENEISWRKSPQEFLRRAVRKYGECFHFRLKGHEIYFISEPEAVREVLVTKDKFFIKGPSWKKLRPWLGNGVVTSDGEMHKRQRRMLQPAFHHKRIEGYAAVMTEESELAAQSLKEGETIDLLKFIEAASFQVSNRCMFDTSLDADRQKFFEAMREGIRCMDNITAYTLMGFFKRWTGQGEKETTENVRLLHTMVDDIIVSRRQDTQDRNDLLSLLVSTLDEEGDGKGLSDEEVRDQVMTLLVAGYDTVASSVTSCLLQLALHPEIEQGVVEEMKQKLGGRPAGLREAMTLEKTSAAFSEALRLYPPAWTLPRTTTEAVEIGGFSIPAKATVVVSSYVTQHNPKYYPDPEKFDPSRWQPGQKEGRHKFAYYPFGGGSRVCMGEQFAWLEANILMSSLLTRWRFEPAFEGPARYMTTASLRPIPGQMVIVRRRG